MPVALVMCVDGGRDKERREKFVYEEEYCANFLDGIAFN